MMRIYGDISSGNCLKVKYLADKLNLAYDWVNMDVTKGQSRTEAFLALSPMGQVPIVELADRRVLAQSNAILRFLARGSALLPDDPYAQAQVDEWLFWEQNSHEFFVAGVRFQMVYLGRTAQECDPWRVSRANEALDFMDRILGQRTWFAGSSFTIADIALVAYTRLAREGALDVDARTHLCRWISDCERELGLGPVTIVSEKGA